jgi:uncharacterized protein
MPDARPNLGITTGARRRRGPGWFVWHDLVTTDVDRARRFYADLFGWRYRVATMGAAGEYTVIDVGACAIGGMVSLDPAPGISSHWLAYVATDDLDAAVGKATSCGGSVLVRPTDVANAGRFAVLADPAGAAVAPFVYAGTEPEDAPVPPTAGTVGWNELVSSDPERACGFYEAVFGWNHEPFERGGTDPYRLFKRADVDVAGMTRTPAGAPPSSAWLPYIAVADVEVALARARSLGGRERHARGLETGLGRLAAYCDPTGASFGLCPMSVADRLLGPALPGSSGPGR